MGEFRGVIGAKRSETTRSRVSGRDRSEARLSGFERHSIVPRVDTERSGAKQSEAKPPAEDRGEAASF